MNSIFRALILAGSVLFCCLALTYGSKSAWAQAPTLNIVVSIPPQADLVTRLIGKRATIKVLLPSGSNHELFEPGVGQIAAISGAKAYVIVGHPLFQAESRYLETIHSSTRQKPLIIDMAKGVDLDPKDIHYWTSPRALLQTLPNLVSGLSSLCPEAVQEIKAREQELRTTLENLDSNLISGLGPYRGRNFLVYHPSWGYLARDYGLIQLSIENQGKEPGLAQLEQLISKVKSLNIKTVFAEPGTSKGSIKHVVDAIGGKEVILDPVAGDWIKYLGVASKLITLSIEESRSK